MTEKKSQTRSPWPRAIIASFLALAVFDGVIVSLALRSSNSDIEENSYEAGQKYEDIIEGKRASVRDHLESSISSSEGSIKIRVDRLPEALPVSIQVALLRPSDGTLDRRETVNQQSSSFAYTSARLHSGLWLVRLEITGPKIHYSIGPAQVMVTE